MTRLLSALFIKDHENVKDPVVRRSYGTLVSVIGIIMNLVLFFLKLIAGVLSGSVSIRADAVNNLSDAGSQLILLLTFKLSAKPADREHPFGHARIEYIASLVISFIVLYIGLDLLTESFSKIFSPELPEKSITAIIILIASIAIKMWLGIFNRTIGKKIDSSAMRATAADCFSDMISTSAVLISILIPVVFPSVKINLDAYMGIIVAVIILIAGVKIFLEAKDSILGEAPSQEIVKKITDVVNEYPGALGIHDLVVHNYGANRIVAALHVEVDGKVDIFESHDMVDNIEKRLRTECGIQATLHMDPIVTNDEKVDVLRTKTLAAVKAVDESLNIHDFRCVEGKTHTNLIFDLSVPFEVSLKDDEICRRIEANIKENYPDYYTVITVDRQ
ncbi:MAG: cation transporter [Ruminococcaceae bacterium]|nr:cation transporter [Oscillospiraceae bacterium]